MSIPHYYCANLKRMPRIAFSKAYQAQNFVYSFPRVSAKLCEFTYIQEGVLLEDTPEGTEMVPEGSVVVTVLGRPVRHRSDSPSFRVFEAGVIFAAPLQPMTEEAVCQWVPKAGEAIITTRITDDKVTKKLETHIKNIVRLYRSGERDRFLAMQAEILHILRILTDYAVSRAHAESVSGSCVSEYCRRTCDYVAQHLTELIREDELARQLDIAPCYLSRLFSSSMGMTLTEYIHRARLQQACRLLQESDANLQQVAEAVGFSSAKYLSRIFGRYMGMTVTEFRRVQALGNNPLQQDRDDYPHRLVITFDDQGKTVAATIDFVPGG